jgi:hypothetical protein
VIITNEFNESERPHEKKQRLDLQKTVEKKKKTIDKEGKM